MCNLKFKIWSVLTINPSVTGWTFLDKLKGGMVRINNVKIILKQSNNH